MSDRSLTIDHNSFINIILLCRIGSILTWFILSKVTEQTTVEKQCIPVR